MQAQEKFSILLVDDDRTMVRILSHILSDFRPIRFATSGRLALKLARESAPDLVLLDVDMPEFSGFEVCKEFKNDPALAQVPIIFVTSHESPQLESLGMQLGAADFIGKPPHAALVLARVRTYQRLKALSDTLRSAVTAYNAEFGEQKGDACLHSVADALRSAAPRPTDVLGRYAGGKFALVLPETSAQGASTVARRAIDAVDALNLLHSASSCHGHITVSVGGACRNSTRQSIGESGAKDERTPKGAVPDDLIEAAEQALKGARSAGGHQVRLVDIVELGYPQLLNAQIPAIQRS